MKLIKIIAVIVVLLSFCSNAVYAGTAWISGQTITGIWMMPTADRLVFTLSGSDSHSKLWVGSEEKEAIAFILNAYNNQVAVDVQWEDTNVFSPWASFGTAYNFVFIKTTSGNW